MSMKYILIGIIINAFFYNTQGYKNKRRSIELNDPLRKLLSDGRTGCSDVSMCKSKWGYCGHVDAYCGEGCQSGPCTNSSHNSDGGDIINPTNFQCAFDTLNDETRAQRLDGLRQSGWKPQNTDEAAVFLAHVYHETDGLKTLIEYCAPGKIHRRNINNPGFLPIKIDENVVTDRFLL